MGEFLRVLLVAVSVFILLVYFSYNGLDHVPKVFRWLKGSRKSYYLSNKFEIETDKELLGSLTTRSEFGIGGSIIEISRGPFRRRSAIYGPAAKNWKIDGDWFNSFVDLQHGYCVSLIDNHGLPIEQALRLINTYPSLQAMLDRIANLEAELLHARSKVAERAAVLQALDQKLTADKQRFRGSPAKEIQANIRFALRKMGEQNVYRQSVDVWLTEIEKPEANIL